MTEHNHWQLIPVEEYQCPKPPPVLRIQRQWRRVLRTLGLVKSEALPVGEVEAVADSLDFATPALQSALTRYLAKANCPHQVCFLLDPPFSGTAAMARTWGWQQGRVLLTPPTLEQIAKGAVDDWWQQQTAQVQRHASQNHIHSNHDHPHQPQGQAWLLDDLTGYFLRTAEHLSFIRVWLPRVLAGEFGDGLIVCDSWAFAFLSRDWPHNLASRHCLAPATPNLLRQLGFADEERLLARLMGEARGNLGVAWAIWHAKYLKQQPLPVLPITANDHTGFILYALLIHQGLSFSQLQQVLSNVGVNELKLQLLSLSQRGIIHGGDEHESELEGRLEVGIEGGLEDVSWAESEQYASQQWRITALAYIPVREFLGGRDYLLDDF